MSSKYAACLLVRYDALKIEFLLLPRFMDKVCGKTSRIPISAWGSSAKCFGLATIWRRGTKGRINRGRNEVECDEYEDHPIISRMQTPYKNFKLY